jgi:hypothetical protein
MRLSGRQPGQATRGIAPLTTSPIFMRLARGLPPLVYPPARARREEYHLCPPIPFLRARPGAQAGAYSPSSCGVASITSTGPLGNCCTATPASTNPAGSCRSPAKPAAPRAARPAPRSTGRHLPAHPSRAEWRQGNPGYRREAPVRLRHPYRTLLRTRSTPTVRKAPGYCDAIPAGETRPARTATGCPAPRDTLLTTTGSAIRCARTATTTPAPSCSTPAPPNYGAASSSPCAACWPAGPG